MRHLAVLRHYQDGCTSDDHTPNHNRIDDSDVPTGCQRCDDSDVLTTQAWTTSSLTQHEIGEGLKNEAAAKESGHSNNTATVEATADQRRRDVGDCAKRGDR
jgi:hypothetical protein